MFTDLFCFVSFGFHNSESAMFIQWHSIPFLWYSAISVLNIILQWFVFQYEYLYSRCSYCLSTANLSGFYFRPVLISNLVNALEILIQTWYYDYRSIVCEQLHIYANFDLKWHGVFLCPFKIACLNLCSPMALQWLRYWAWTFWSKLHFFDYAIGIVVIFMPWTGSLCKCRTILVLQVIYCDHSTHQIIYSCKSIQASIGRF